VFFDFKQGGAPSGAPLFLRSPDFWRFSARIVQTDYVANLIRSDHKKLIQQSFELDANTPPTEICAHFRAHWYENPH
jgi:hypothetical protein